MNERLAVKENCKSFSSLAGSFMLMLVRTYKVYFFKVFGSMYITGNISPYIKIYFNKLNGRDDACTDADAFLLLPGITICQTLMLPISGFLSLKMNHRL